MKTSYEFKTFANQRVINVDKKKCNKAELYATINLDAMSKAAIDLDASTFKLWIYFAKNQDKYTFALSSKDVKETFGIKIDSYNRAMKILMDKKYLIETSSNHYTFYEVPHEEEPLEEQPKKKTILEEILEAQKATKESEAQKVTEEAEIEDLDDISYNDDLPF